jgi:hypothetical protein
MHTALLMVVQDDSVNNILYNINCHKEQAAGITG